MAIEKELETLHTNLKALGAAREKLDFVSSNVATVTEAIVRTGDSMQRLAEMPELTERVRTSVDRLINESRSQQILSVVQTIGPAIQNVSTDVHAVAASLTGFATNMADGFRRQDEKLVDAQKSLENNDEKQQAELQACRQKLGSVNKVALTAVVLGVLQFGVLIVLLAKTFR